MRYLSVLILLLSISVFVTAQKLTFKYGDIPIEDIKMTRYPNDTSAAAVVLADQGESSIEYDEQDGFILRFERLRRVKILTKDGLDYANFSIPLYHEGGNDEKILSLKAVTYNFENGKVVETKLKNDGIFKENQSANIDITKLTMPNVKVGSLIEISYVVRSEFIFNFQDWEFQSEIPTVWSEYRSRIPEYFHYERYMQGYVPITINEATTAAGGINLLSKERTGGEGFSASSTSFSNTKVEYKEFRNRWAVKDVPAFKAEPFITTPNDYISKINFELASVQYPNQIIKKYMGSWEDINTQYLDSENFGKEITGNGFLKKIVEDITAGKTTAEDKIKAISDYVKLNVEWDGSSRRYTSKSFKKVLEEKKGNSSDINLLLASMLEKAEIKVNPVLISTRDHGFVRESSAISSQFNYAICYAVAGDKVFLLDATERLLPTGMLPQRCINGNGFLVAKEGFQWVKLQSPTKSRTFMSATLTLSESGDLKGDLLIERGGFDALVQRKKYLTKNETEYVKEMVAQRPWEVSKTEIQNAKEISLPLKEKYELQINEHVVSTPTALYINPFLLHRIEENPFKLENRDYPVDYGSAFERIYMFKLTIPDGYVIDELPQSKVMMLAANAGKYTYSMTQAGSVLSFVSNLQINKSIFAQSEYPNLREFYNLVVAKQAEQIVLKKK